MRQLAAAVLPRPGLPEAPGFPRRYTVIKLLQRTAVPAIMVLVVLTPASQAQQALPSQEQAAAALAAAVKSGTNRAILKLLGPAADDIIDSGDEVADAEMRQRFTAAYDAKHSIKTEGNKKATLIVGDDDFPFPIPLYNTSSGWEFDTKAGRLEILYRRIGRNELDTIQTSLAYVDVQNEYAEKDHGLGVVVNSKMIGGFALIAYPAEYGNSGVMTFIVNHSGTVYEKDLGRWSDVIAKRMRLFDPDQTWKKVDLDTLAKK